MLRIKQTGECFPHNRHIINKTVILNRIGMEDGRNAKKSRRSIKHPSPILKLISRTRNI
jgi:hypothetical protein